MYCFMLKLMVLTFCHIVYLRANNITKYVSRGMSTVLECQVDLNSKAIWDGPNWESGSVVYADGPNINPNLFNKRKLKLVGSIAHGEYNMEIRNISAREEGVYRCSQRNLIKMTGRDIFVLLLIQVEPKNAKIHGKINGRLVGQEGVHLQLLCTVTSGIPNETITWYNMSSAIDTGGPAILNTTITPSRYDHKKTYICRINNTLLQESLQEIVTLDIQYAPRMSFKHPNHLRTNEGTNVTIVCTWDSNPLTMVNIHKDNKLINTRCHQFSCSFTLENISWIDNGLYKCSGYNKLGEGQTNITIIVQSPPIFLATNRRVQFGQYGRDLNITVILYSKLDIIRLNVSKMNNTLKPNITISRFHTPDLFRGLDERVSEITVVFNLGLATEKDFVNYTIDACNREGCNAYYVYLKSAKYEQTILPAYNACSVIIGIIIGGMFICCIASYIYCRLRRQRRSTAAVEISPDGQYDEIGTINYNNGIVDPITNFEVDNNDHRPTEELGIDVISSAGSDSSSATSFIGQTGDGYENEYKAIIPSIIEMHQYLGIIPNIYQNTIISPANLATSSAEYINTTIHTKS